MLRRILNLPHFVLSTYRLNSHWAAEKLALTARPSWRRLMSVGSVHTNIFTHFGRLHIQDCSSSRRSWTTRDLYDSLPPRGTGSLTVHEETWES